MTATPGRGRPRKSGFSVVRFRNPSGDLVWRVQGSADGRRVRENYPSEARALERRRELEREHLQAEPEPESLRATSLTREQLSEAEAAWVKLAQAEAGPGSLLGAVDVWLRMRAEGQLVPVVVYFGDAMDQFQTWVNQTPTLRDRTRKNLRTRLEKFRVRVGHRAIHEITPDDVDRLLNSRQVSARSRANDRLVLSRLMSWCMERPRCWIKSNPVSVVKVEVGELEEPTLLTVAQAEALLRAAQETDGGRMVPYLAVGLFAGIRNAELGRLTWGQFNLADGTVRLEGRQTKPGKARVVDLQPNLIAWLKWADAHGQRDLAYDQRSFVRVREAAGFIDWPVNAIRHTGLSFLLKRLGSFADTAMAGGNSEKMLREHYVGRVSAADTEKFFGLLP
ncbi:MAG: tyrosine-type recombinase/integrase [Verrucomicrobiae bacterium]|nr:tyrosine-type recombinase/integrase [Verrucomicrobiae bacterium]